MIDAIIGDNYFSSGVMEGSLVNRKDLRGCKLSCCHVIASSSNVTKNAGEKGAWFLTEMPTGIGN